MPTLSKALIGVMIVFFACLTGAEAATFKSLEEKDGDLFVLKGTVQSDEDASVIVSKIYMLDSQTPPQPVDSPVEDDFDALVGADPIEEELVATVVEEDSSMTAAPLPRAMLMTAASAIALVGLRKRKSP